MAGNDPDEKLELAHLAIAQLALDDDSGLAVALQRAVEISGTTLGVTHVGVWLLDPLERRLVLSAEFRHDEKIPVRPPHLPLDAWPRYAAAIGATRILAADDARTDARCAELVEPYLVPFDVHALLDAALFVGGHVVGVVCHEQAGAPRRWLPHERAFAAAVADMLSALFEQARRLRAEKDVRIREQQLSRARRREVVAQMSAGVAHDFRNALQVIYTSVSLARRERDETKRSELLDAALEEADRANRLTRQLTDLARDRDVVRAALDVAALVEVLAPTLERITSEKGLTLRIDVAPRARAVRVSAEHTLLERAIVNLLTNAAEASPPRARVDLTVDVQDGRLLLEVADSGPGVAPEHRARVFDPFFTTKELGGGTGLGLAVVALAAELFGGEVTIDTREGGGARFVMSLPTCESPSSAPSEDRGVALPA